MWWPGPPKGSADILSVVPDEWQINLRFASPAPSQRGGQLKIYRPQYLEKLESLWSDPGWSASCLNVLNSLGGDRRASRGAGLSPSRFPQLRQAQQDAFRLTQYEPGFLWGPPGTGKTTTLGMMLASCLIQFPATHILLLSTTNVAADEALIAVDAALAEIPSSQALRNKCQRIGNHFIVGKYEKRRHLLPVADEAALKRLVQLEAGRPDPAHVQAYDRRKREVEAARKALGLWLGSKPGAPH
ncbi:MAG: AAA domain-containing protein [Candidatus Sulfopaludibacter sp.]|nr:AAA domain-containing protein [Candidatus Sulfopaludibacter sp.]